MKCFLYFFLGMGFISFGQEQSVSKISKKGSFNIYWGWNRDAYTKSDITFQGNDYNFELKDVQARDRQSPLSVDTYLNPANFTIPQYNARIGYFITDKYSITLGMDHMKYVMVGNQTATISGAISKSGTAYDGSYNGESIVLAKEFLLFEHTDGLNYWNTELRRTAEVWRKGKFAANLSEGFGVGVLLPRTNTTLMGNPRYDQFHLSGFGIAALVAMNIEFNERVFLQTEMKVGFINMPSIRTTMFEADKAKQHFSFIQSNIVLGVNLNTKKSKK